MQHTIPYTSQQNGITEINNHIFKEMENCMIQFKGLSPDFWEEINIYEITQ